MKSTLGMLAVLACVALVGCGTAATDSDDGQVAELTPAMTAILKKADALDGSTDNVVSKCVTCGPSMDGKEAHTAKLGDYELLLCSAGCKEHFEEDAEGALSGFDV